MYDRDDVLRSIRRALTVPGAPLAGWEQVHLSREQARGQRLPVATIEALAMPRGTGSRAPGMPRDLTLPVQIVALPGTEVVEEDPDGALAARAARLHAARLAQAMYDLFAFGPASPPLFPIGHVAAGRPAAGPERIALYDYSTAPAIGAARGGAEDPHGLIHLDAYDVDDTQQGSEPVFRVTANLTVSWRHPGAPDPDADAPVVGQTPPATFVPGDPPVLAGIPGQYTPPE